MTSGKCLSTGTYHVLFVRLLKELTLQQDPLNIYILQADVQQGVFTAEAALTMLDGELAHRMWLYCICHSRGSALENRLPRSSFCLNCPSSSFANKPPVFFPSRTQLSHHLKCLPTAPTGDWMQLCPPHHSLPESAEIIHCNRQILGGVGVGVWVWCVSFFFL